MIPLRAVAAFGLAVVLGAPQAAAALSLPEAIALAEGTSPTLARSMAQADATEARLAQARAGRLPSVTLSGEAGRGTTDLGGFFGFGQADVSPRAAALELRQPAFTGGAVDAAIDRAREGRRAALAQVVGARAMLSADVAQAYVAVLSAGEILALNQAQVAQLSEIARQADLRFQAGEVPRTDTAQAEAGLARAQADLARAQGDLARGRARFVALVGAPPDGLEPLPPPPAVPASLAEAMALALRDSPALVSAQAQAQAAEAGVRQAEAARLPSFALTATASTARDQFFPGYRADNLTVGVQGRWTLFSGGLTKGRIDEARAEARGAASGLRAARAEVVAAVVGAWEDVQTARAVVEAADDQVRAASSALDSVRNEVRVGQKPTLDLLDAEREALAARAGLVAARGGAVTAAYRLNALLQGD